jgi:hypothetical protein
MKSFNMVQFRHARTAGGIRASIRATSTVGEIRVGTWAGISTRGSITAGIEVPALAGRSRQLCAENGRCRKFGFPTPELLQHSLGA